MSGRIDLTCQLTHQVRLSIQELHLLILPVAHLIDQLVEKQRCYLQVLACHKKCSETCELHVLRLHSFLSEHKEPISHICCDEGQSEIFLWKDIAHMSDPVNQMTAEMPCQSWLMTIKNFLHH